MMKRLVFICALFSIFSLHAFEVKDGIVDFSGWNLDDSAVETLHGEWEFYFGKHSPQEIASGEVRKHDNIRVPMNWLEDKDVNGNPKYRPGIATYRVVIKNMPSTRLMGVKFDSLNNAAVVYWNGRPLDHIGYVGSNEYDTQYSFDKSVIKLPLVRGENELIIQVANYHERTAGISADVHIGSFDNLVGKRNRNMVMDFLFFGVFMTMGFYHLFMFLFRLDKLAPLFFALLNIALGIRTLVLNELGIQMLFNWNWNTILTVNYMSTALVLVFFMLYLFFQFQDDSDGRLIGTLVTLGAAYAITIGIGGFIFGKNGVKMYTQDILFYAFYALIAASLIYSIFIIIKAITKKRNGAVAFLLIFIAFAITVVNDMLFSISILPGANIMSFGLMGFVLLQSFLINRQFAHALEMANNLSTELQSINISMQRFVPKAFLGFLHKEKIYDVKLGDNSKMQMTVLFADIRRFTTISESMSSEEVFAFLNSFLAEMGPIIRNHGGFVDKYMGDGIMALFPESTEGAVGAAVEMRKALTGFNEKWLDKIDSEAVSRIDMGIGIHYGGLMLGTIGEHERMDGTVISDAVNLSARLQELTKKLHIGILVSKDAYKNLTNPDDFWFRSIGKVAIRGKQKQVGVYEVFSADPEALQQRKLQSLADFEQGKYYLLEGDSSKALEYLNRVKELLPTDKVVEQYLMLAAGGGPQDIR